MAVIRPTFPDDHFTRVPNAWLRDPHLDPAPKAYLAYLLSHAAGYRCSTSQAAREMGVNRGTVSAWNAKLLERGYFTTVEQTRARGRWGENDYTVTPCTDSTPPVPEDPSLFPRETVGKSTVLEKPTRSNRARSTHHIEEQGGEEQPTPTGLGAAGLRVIEDHDAAARIAQTIAAEHYEAVGKLGGNKAFLAARGIITAALEAGHTPEQLRPALESLRRRGRPLTNSTLGPLLADPRLAAAPSGNGHKPYRDPVTPDAYAGPF